MDGIADRVAAPRPLYKCRDRRAPGALSNRPLGRTYQVFTYRLGNRSALDWIIDQYQVYTDPRSNITSDPNAWGNERDDPEYIVRLVKQVVTVSLESMKIVNALPAEFIRPTEPTPSPQPDDPEPSAPKFKAGKKFTLRADPAPQPRLRQ